MGIFSPSGLLRIIGKSLFNLRRGRKMKGVLFGDSGTTKAEKEEKNVPSIIQASMRGK